MCALFRPEIVQAGAVKWLKPSGLRRGGLTGEDREPRKWGTGETISNASLSPPES